MAVTIFLHRVMTTMFLIHLLSCQLLARTTDEVDEILELSTANITGNNALQSVATFRQSHQRMLAPADDKEFCDPSAQNNPEFQSYFGGMSTIYKGQTGSTCIQNHMECGWPSISRTGKSAKELPLLVLSVGLEGAGHHLWTEILSEPVFDCVWVNARHYRRDIADGVPRATSAELEEGEVSDETSCEFDIVLLLK